MLDAWCVVAAVRLCAGLDVGSLNVSLLPQLLFQFAGSPQLRAIHASCASVNRVNLSHRFNDVPTPRPTGRQDHEIAGTDFDDFTACVIGQRGASR